jgi:thiosulfate/3-mercaptopyruvate sulfurtransferase
VPGGSVAGGSVAVADVRWYLDGRSGQDAWAAGHIPGAVWVDIDTDLAGPVRPGSGRHPLPPPDTFLARLAARGFVAGTPIVAYDDAGGSIAARLWWMLDRLGWEVAVLDGGLDAWSGPLETGRDLASAPASPDPGSGVPAGAHWASPTTIDTSELAGRQRQPGVVVLDARSAERYRGEPNPADPRPGHIPGSRSAPWTANLDPMTGRFLPPAALRARFEALGVAPGTEVVSSCGSGVTACHNLLALRLAGLDGGGRLYPGSWSAWAADPGLPVVTGPHPS